MHLKSRRKNFYFYSIWCIFRLNLMSASMTLHWFFTGAPCWGESWRNELPTYIRWTQSQLRAILVPCWFMHTFSRDVTVNVHQADFHHGFVDATSLSQLKVSGSSQNSLDNICWKDCSLLGNARINVLLQIYTACAIGRYSLDSGFVRLSWV